MFLVLVFIIGFLYRVLIIVAQPQGFMSDQWEYHTVAQGIMERGLFVSSYRLYGYPLILAFVYRAFGTEAQIPWTVLNILFDLGSAVLVYHIARRVFLDQNIAIISFVIYLINPFTSGYTGVRLTEIPATFLVTLIFFLMIVYYSKRKSVVLPAIMALLLGFLPQVRPSFLFYSIGLILFLFSRVGMWVSHARKLITLFLVVLLYCLPFTYNVVGNYVYFQEFSPLTVHNMFVREFYISLFTGNGTLLTEHPPEVRDIYFTYTSMAHKEYRDMVARKYWRLAVEKIQSNPWEFLFSRLRKMWYVWEKHVIYPYTNLYGESVRRWIYWSNIAFIGISFLGLGRYRREGSRQQRRLHIVVGKLAALSLKIF